VTRTGAISSWTGREGGIRGGRRTRAPAPAVSIAVAISIAIAKTIAAAEAIVIAVAVAVAGVAEWACRLASLGTALAPAIATSNLMVVSEVIDDCTLRQT